MIWLLLATALLTTLTEPRLSPDGRYYLRLGVGEAVPRPYALRWLLPWLLGTRVGAWRVVSVGSMVVAAATFGWLSGRMWLGGLLFLGLAGVRTSAVFPVLLDLPALATLGTALVACQGFDSPWVGVGVAVVGATVNERLPLFAALLTGEPWMLLGMLPVAVAWWRAPKPTADDPEWLQHPVRAALAKRRTDWDDWRVMALPWGALLLGLLNWELWTWQEWVVMGLAYAQLGLAQDAARVYLWAVPVLLPHSVAVVGALPEAVLVPIVIGHWLWPWRKVL